MLDGQYALDGFTFGRGTPIGVRSVDRGANVVRNQDHPAPGRPGRMMGHDIEDGGEWTLELMARAASGPAVKAALAELAEAWRRPYRAGQFSVLRWQEYGQVRRVYGRARDFRDFAHPHLIESGRIPTLATFQLADPIVYDDAAHSLDLGLLSAPGGGVVWPVSFPFVWGSAPGRRDGEVVVGGRVPVPFELTFHGPASGSASGFWAAGAGWRVDLAATLAWDQSVTIDTRTGTVLRSDGRSLAGNARGRFLTARLQPGAQEVSWGATDPTGTARMTLTHRPGHWSI